MDPYVLETFQLVVIKNCGFSSYSSHRLITKKLLPYHCYFLSRGIVLGKLKLFTK